MYVYRESVCTCAHTAIYECVYIVSPVDLNSSQAGRGHRGWALNQRLLVLFVFTCLSLVCAVMYVYMYNVHVLCAHVPVGNTSSASLLEPHFGITEIAEEKPGQNTYILIFTGPVHSACAVSQAKNNPDTKLDPCCCHQLISQGYSYHA